ncbi:MAG: aminoglycoside phosphotransferase family protein [Candidatus Peribacteraceae bacterium]
MNYRTSKIEHLDNGTDTNGNCADAEPDATASTLTQEIRRLIGESLANCQRPKGEALPEAATQMIAYLEHRFHRQIEKLTQQHSVTNIVLDDGPDNPVVKIVLEKPLGFVARRPAKSQHLALSPQKADREVAVLNILHKRGIRTPQIIDQHGGVIVMEFISGQRLSEKTLDNSINDIDLQITASNLARIHTVLDDAEPELTAYLDDDANIVVNFNKKTVPVLNDPDFTLLPVEQQEQFADLTERVKALLQRNTQYEEATNIVYGDWKDENIIIDSDKKLSVLDPWICRGRPSMDIAKFGRALLFKNIQAFKDHFSTFVDAYQFSSGKEIPCRELLSMLAIDLINNLRSYLLIRQDAIGQFPDFVKDVREHSSIFLRGIIPTLLDEAMENEPTTNPLRARGVCIKQDVRFQRANFPRTVCTADIAHRIHVPADGEHPPLVVIGTVCRGVGTAFLNCFADHYPSYFQPFKTVMRHVATGGDLTISIPPDGHCASLPVVLKESFGPYFQEESILDVIEILELLSYPKDKIHYVGVLRNPSAVFSSWLQHFPQFNLSRLEESFLQTYHQLQTAKLHGIKTTALVSEQFARYGTDAVFGALSRRLELPIAINGQWSGQGFGKHFIKIQEPDIFRIHGIHEKVKTSDRFLPAQNTVLANLPRTILPFIRRLEETYELMRQESETDFGGFNERCTGSVHDGTIHPEPEA